MSKPKTYEDVLSIIAKNIKKHRKQKGLTQEDMMDFGFNYRFYQKLESGKYSPNLQTLFRLSKVFEVQIQNFFI